MDWMLVITMVIEAIMKCMENRSREEILEGLCDPGALETIMLRRILIRDFGLRGKKLRKACKEGITALKATPREVLVGWVDEAEELASA
jgi:hypothetical protein